MYSASESWASAHLPLSVRTTNPRTTIIRNILGADIPFSFGPPVTECFKIKLDVEICKYCLSSDVQKTTRLPDLIRATSSQEQCMGYSAVAPGRHFHAGHRGL